MIKVLEIEIGLKSLYLCAHHAHFLFPIKLSLFSQFPILPPYISIYFIIAFSSKLSKKYISKVNIFIHSLGFKFSICKQKHRTSNWDEIIN